MLLIFDETAFAEVGVKAASGKELGVAAAFGDAATFEDENLVGVADGREAVGYDEACAVFHEAVECLLDEALGGGVHAGCGFVEDEDGRIFKEGACDREALFFPDTEFDSALTERRVQAFGKALDEIGGVGGA